MAGQLEQAGSPTEDQGRHATNERQLAESISARLKETHEALQRGEDERAVRCLQEAVSLKRQLWARLEPLVRSTAARFARYAERQAGMTEGDLLDPLQSACRSPVTL